MTLLPILPLLMFACTPKDAADDSAPSAFSPSEGAYAVSVGVMSGTCEDEIGGNSTTMHLANVDTSTFSFTADENAEVSWTCTLEADRSFTCPPVVTDTWTEGGAFEVQYIFSWAGAFTDAKSASGTLTYAVTCEGDCASIVDDHDCESTYDFTMSL